MLRKTIFNLALDIPGSMVKTLGNETDPVQTHLFK